MFSNGALTPARVSPVISPGRLAYGYIILHIHVRLGHACLPILMLNPSVPPPHSRLKKYTQKEKSMDKFVQLFGRSIRFAYHCFDRIVIRGYLSALSLIGFPLPEH
jgi:hypothetical protein